LINSGTELIGSHWCGWKNSIVNGINKREDFDPALTPHLKPEYNMWKNEDCFNIRRVGGGRR
jgi:hypothetical protein